MAKEVGTESVVISLQDTLVSYQPVELAGTAAPEVTGQTRYVERAEIGRGGLGVVVEAFDQDLRRNVAIKRPRDDRRDPTTAAALVKEAQITAQLDHPNIPAVHALGIDGSGRPFFAMTRLGGQSLAALLAAARSDPGLVPSNARLLRIFLQVGYAVAFAHSRGVLHRDLKPDNIIIGDFGEVRLMDWGLAKLIAEPCADADAGAPVTTGDGPSFTRTGALVGTPGYAAPEQLTPDQPIDVRVDVYALGALLYTMLTRRPPIVGDDLEQLLDDTREGRVPPLQSLIPVSDRTAAIVHKALAVDPDHRYSDVMCLLEDVEALLEGRPVTAHEEGVLSRLGHWYMGRSPSLARLRTFDLDALAWGSFLLGVSAGAYWGHWLPDWAQWLVLCGGLLSLVPFFYTLFRRARPDDPGAVMAFTEGLSSSPHHHHTPATPAGDLATAPTVAPGEGELATQRVEEPDSR